MWPWQQMDLGHIDGSGKQAYAGLEHMQCNRAAGARLKNARYKVMTVTWRPSRNW